MSDDLILELRRSPAEAFHVPLPESTLTVGRGDEADICLPDPERHLSRVHVEVRRRAHGVLVVDRSANGSWLEGRRLSPDAPKAWRAPLPLELPGWTLLLRSAPRPGSDEATQLRAWRPALAASLAASERAVDAGFHGLVGRSSAMAEVAASVCRLAPHDVPVLIRGETGSGKELIARAIHAESGRRAKPFVAVNCGGIHDQTAASRLFGHARGAFTGADTASAGAFREADGGTLFLDELGELPAAQQAALLRALERKEVVPLGTNTPVPVDFRLIAATHRDLDEMVARGTFRQDLLFRLDVGVVAAPPLRERPEDIPTLAAHFLSTLRGGQTRSLAPGAIDGLQRHDWPGNVRELRNALVRGMLASPEGPIELRHLALARPRGVAAGALHDGSGQRWHARGPESPRVRTAKDLERAQLLRALDAAAGNKKEAARLLGVARSTFYSRLARHGLE